MFLGFFLRIAVAVVLSIISAALAYRKPEVPDAGTLDDLGNPRADEGSEVKKIFGTVTVADPQVVWFGDFRTSPIIEVGPRRYGIAGPKSRTVVGYNYYLGLHFVPCLGPVDFLSRIRIDKRVAYTGANSGGSLSICKPTLFGAAKREGGVVGDVDVMMGLPDQTANAYLSSVTEGPHSAYRGVVSIVLNSAYIGNAPNLRPWEFRLSRLLSVDPGYNEGEQWLPDLAQIFQRFGLSQDEPQWLHIAIDNSGSMAGTRFENAKAAVVGLLETLRGNPSPDSGLDAASIATLQSRAANGLNNIRIIFWSSEVNEVIQRVGALDADYAAMIAFVNDQTVSGGTNFEAPYADAAVYFALSDRCEDRKMLFVTDGESVDNLAEAQLLYQSFDNVSVLGVSIDVPISGALRSVTDRAIRVDGGDPVALEIAFSSLFAEYDMNPAHILREVLLSPDTGGSGIDAEAGDTWEDAAQTLYEEGFGLSMVWASTSNREEFKKKVEAHVDARSFIDRRTGLWEIKLIRDDYDEEDLYVFDRSNVISWKSINFPEPHTLVNQLVITWTDPEKDEKASLTISNPARIRMNNSLIVADKIEYPGITKASLASRAASRDLAARSAPLITGEFITTYLPYELNLGSVIKIHNPKLKIFNRIVRITEIEDGDILENAVLVRFVEDRFSIADDAVLEIDSPITSLPFPAPVANRIVEELPRYLAIQQLGPVTYEEAETADANVGFIHHAGASPNSIALEINYQKDPGAGYIEDGPFPFVLGGQLISYLPVRADQGIMVVQSTWDLTEVDPGTLARISTGEHVVVLSTEAGSSAADGDYWFVDPLPGFGVYTVTVQRGCLDTSPVDAEPGSYINFYGENVQFDDQPYTDGNSLGVKLQTITSRGTLNLAATPEDIITMNRRALRPYPPGRVRVDGSYAMPIFDNVSTYTVTWVHRDRLENTLLGHVEAGPVSAEAGVSYRVLVRALGFDGEPTGSPLVDTNVGSLLTYSLDTTLYPVDPSWAGVRINVISVRSGIESLFNTDLELAVILDVPGLAGLAWIDANDSGSVFEDLEGLVPASTDSDPVALIESQSTGGFL